MLVVKKLRSILLLVSIVYELTREHRLLADQTAMDE